ncbi:MAG: MarR family transcriptional regulator [Candidatus Eremiobacteraeota bacterium]|nr:MarR family transcriptional regulator [Candidatus Eremiobacteraeota bacterium]MBV8264090.1 MarR family transcriptional regulator [Candidatus Eremiobacteraeota bacterium]
MSRTSSKLAVGSPPEPDIAGQWDALYLPTVKALINAGITVSDELTRLASRQGLSSKPMTVCIWNLFHMGRVTAGDLARCCGADAGNLSALLDRLEEAGLVEREPCSIDRRVRYVQLSHRGRQIAAAVQRDYKRSGIYTELNRLSERERESFTKILSNIVAAANR